jgi:hypothetical protein
MKAARMRCDVRDQAERRIAGVRAGLSFAMPVPRGESRRKRARSACQYVDGYSAGAIEQPENKPAVRIEKKMRRISPSGKHFV